jgi:Holliday junction DNA helicase RuvA
MIGSLRGTLIDRWGDGEVLIEVAGVGYRVTVTPTTFVELGEPGADVFVHIHHQQREDAQILYGFGTRAERDSFEVLLGTHGVGVTVTR